MPEGQKREHMFFTMYRNKNNPNVIYRLYSSGGYAFPDDLPSFSYQRNPGYYEMRMPSTRNRGRARIEPLGSRVDTD